MIGLGRWAAAHHHPQHYITNLINTDHHVASQAQPSLEVRVIPANDINWSGVSGHFPLTTCLRVQPSCHNSRIYVVNLVYT